MPKAVIVIENGVVSDIMCEVPGIEFHIIDRDDDIYGTTYSVWENVGYDEEEAQKLLSEAEKKVAR